MYTSRLEGKTNEEVYALVTGLTRVSLTEKLSEISNAPAEKQDEMRYQLAWSIPAGKKVNENEIINKLREEIIGGSSEEGGDTPGGDTPGGDTPGGDDDSSEEEDDDSDAQVISTVNRNLASAHQKLDSGDDNLTDDEIDALGADENNDGQITTTQLTDDSGEPLNSSDEKNSEIQVFE